MNTVSVRWVTRMLTPNCTQVSEELLKRYRRDPAKIYFTTCYLGWNVHLQLDSESEQQSIQWNERIGQNCHFITLRNFVFMSNANNRRPL